MLDVLIIDDDEFHATLVAEMLRANGLQVDTLSSPLKFEQVIAEKKPKSILLDIEMPDINGFDLLKKIRESHSTLQLPVIMITGAEGQGPVIKSLQLGANDFLQKPIHSEIALARVKTQLELRNLNRQTIINNELETVNNMIVTYNHEINNPLCVVLGMSQLCVQALEEDPVDLDAIKAHLEQIVKSGNKVSEITEKIKSIGKNGSLDKLNYDKSAKYYKL